MSDYATLPRPQPGVINTAATDELLTAAEYLDWPAVYVQPDHDGHRYDHESTVTVDGEHGWRVFAQLMGYGQLLAARRLLLVLATKQTPDYKEIADGC